MYLLLGYGKSNKSVERFMKKNNLEYFVYDDKFKNKNFILDNKYTIIKSPGISNEHFLIKEAKEKKIRIISDLELFYDFNPNKVLTTVTGTNGKSTTVSILKNILVNNDLGGNIGIPLFDFIYSSKDIIIEASSFMLEYIDNFRSKYNCILNISINHLDRHNTFKEYIKCKLNLLRNIRETDYLIYNYDDLLLRRIVTNYSCYKIPYSKRERIMGCCIKDNYICFNSKKIINLNNINVKGKHNIENILASVALAYCHSASIDRIKYGIVNFKGLEHRIENIYKSNKLRIYNDSKATNFKAINSAIESIESNNILLICGGEKKEDNKIINVDNLFKIKKVYTFGENAEELYDYFIPLKETYKFSSLHDLLNKISLDELDEYETILFSPGSPSFDEFNDFEERGLFFKSKILSVINSYK